MEYSKFILAFQLQFGTYEAESEHFRWEKEKRHFNKWFSRNVDLSYFGYLPDVRFLKPVFKEISNNLYVFKAATYAELHGFNGKCFAQMTNECERTF